MPRSGGADPGEISYVGATEEELKTAAVTKRLVATSDQRRLFPHHGLLRLEGDILALAGWRLIERSASSSIELAFTPAYSRWLGAGVRGQWPSLGWIGDLGKPLIIRLADPDESPIYLLLGFKWWSGTNENRDWLPRLNRWRRGDTEGSAP